LAARIIINFFLVDSAETNEARYFLLCVVPICRGLKMLRRWAMLQLLFACGMKLIVEVLPSLLFLMLVMAQTFATAIYFVEPRSSISSLADAFWFTIITMSTVGYGGTIPVTSAGRVITILLVTMSAIYMAVPIGIVGSAFNQVWENRHRLILTQQVRDRLQNLGLGASDVPSMFAKCGHDGVLTLVEFQRIVNQMRLGIDTEKQLELFCWLDIDENGTIEAKEFVHCFYPHEYANVYGFETRKSDFFVAQSMILGPSFNFQPLAFLRRRASTNEKI